MKFFGLVLFLCLNCLSAASEAAPLTLEDALKQAREHSPQLGRARASADEADWKKTESLGGFLPSLTATGSHLLSVKYQYLNVAFNGGPEVSIPQILPGSTLGLNLSFPVFDGLQNINRFRAASASADASHHDYDWATLSLEQDVKLRFYQAIASRQLQEVAEQNVKALEDHLRQIKLRKEGGLATHYDVLRVEAQMSEAESERLSTMDNTVLARRKLAEVMGDFEALTGGLEIEGRLPEPEGEKARKLSDVDPRTRPDYLSMARASDAAAASRAAQRAFWVPRFSLGGQYLWYNNINPGLTDSGYRTAYQLGVFLNWSIFDMSTLSRAGQAAAQARQAEQSLAAAALKLPNEFEFWKRRYLYSGALYEARKRDIARGEESVRLAKEGYRAGSRTNSDILDAELDLFRARAGAVNAQLGAAEALINLELTAGRRL